MRAPSASDSSLDQADVRVDAPAQAAVGGGHDPLGVDEAGEALDAVGHQLGVLQDVGDVGDDAGDEVLFAGQLDVLPDPPLVLVAGVGRLEAQTVGADRQRQVHDRVEAEVDGVRTVPGAPAHVVAHPGGVDAFQSVVEGLDAHGGEAAVVLQQVGLEVPGLGQVGASIWTVSPTSVIARYSSRSASAHTQTTASSSS